MTTLLIDCNFICHQARTTMPDLHTSKQVCTGILYGFLNRLQTFMEMFDTNQIVLCWDSKSSIRKKLYPQYKEKRHEYKTEQEEEDMQRAVRQFPVVRKILAHYGFLCYIKRQFEADDLFGSIVKHNKDRHFTIITADEDMFQLLDDCKVQMYSPTKKEMWTERHLMKMKGITPKQWVDIKAIGGCSSDKVPGLPGVGEGKAIKYILGQMPDHHKAFSTISEGLADMESDLHLLWYPLVTLPFETTPEIILPEKVKHNYLGFLAMCEQYELQSFIRAKHQWQRVFMGENGNTPLRSKKAVPKRRKGLLD